MALRDLSVGQMIQVGKSWVVEEKNKNIIAGIPKLSPWVADLVKALANLQRQNAGRAATTSALGKVMVEQEREDGIYDRRLRGLFMLKSGLELLAPELNHQPGVFLALQKELFPGGQAMTMRSYADEAAEHELAPARISASSKPLLATSIAGTTLGGLVDTWVSSAKALDALEQKRNTLVSENEAHKSTANMRDARNAWIKAASMLETNLLALDETEIDPATRNVLLAPLRRYEEMAAKGETEAEEEGEAGAPAPAPGGAVVAGPVVAPPPKPAGEAVAPAVVVAPAVAPIAAVEKE